MLLSFRQGVVQYEPEGFLTVTPTNVSLVVDDTPTVITFANGTTDYLLVEHQPVPNAWQITTPGVDQWLYWDIHTFTAVRTFGVTTVAPIVSSQEPQFPVNDQHWFDTANRVMKVWQTNHWTEKLRTFACRLAGGSVPLSLSVNAPAFNGTQVGDNSAVAAGTIMYDSLSGKPLRAGNKFITTEDVLSTTPLTKSDVKTASLFVQGVARVPMARYTAASFSDFGELVYASAISMSGDYAPVGIVQRDCIAGDVVTVTTSGIVTSADWDWSAAGINRPIYCNNSGELTPTQTFSAQRPVGYIIDTNSILVGVTSGAGAAPAENPTNLNDLLDVTVGGESTGQVLAFDGDVWTNTTLPTPVTDLNGLTDVTLTSLTVDQFLKYNGSQWINSVVPTPITNLDGLSDVVITTPANNQVLKFNGTTWVNAAAPGGGGGGASTLDDLTDVDTTTTPPVIGNLLSFDGTNWIPVQEIDGGVVPYTPPPPEQPPNDTLFQFDGGGAYTPDLIFVFA
jgi:hypothetical protein